MNFKIIITLTITFFFDVTEVCGQLLIAVQSHRDSVVIFNPRNGIKRGQVKVGFLPHEICYDQNTKQCFITNFGLEDYDLRIGKQAVQLLLLTH